MKPGTLLPSQFPEDEIHIPHNGTEWIVLSYVDAAHHFEHLADAMKHANHYALRI